MNKSFWHIVFFFAAILALALFLYPSRRQLGLVYSQAGRYDEALPYLSGRYARAPRDLPNSARYLEALLWQGDFKAFQQIAVRMEEIFPREPQVLETLADFYEGQMNFEEASLYWERLMTLGALSPEGNNKLLVYYINTKQKEEQIRFYEREAPRQKTPDYFYSLAQIYSSRRELAEEQRVLIRLLERFPGEEVAKRQLADIYAFNGKKDTALELRRELFRQNPTQLEYSQRLVEDLLTFGKNEEALAVLDEVARFFPDEYSVLLRVAEYSLRAGDKARTKALLDGLSRADQGSVYRPDRMASLYYEMGDYDLAFELLEGFHKDSGGSLHSWNIFGDILAAQGQGPQSRQAYEKALQLAPDSVPLPLELGKEEIAILRKLGRYKQAQDQLEYFLKDNADPELLEMAVYNALDRGRFEEARIYSDRLKAFPSSEVSAGIERARGEVFFQLGDWPAAIAALEAYHRMVLGDYYSHYLLGNVYYGAKEKEAGEREYRQALVLLQGLAHPAMQQELDQLALLIKLEQRQEAGVLLQKMLAAGQEDPQVLAAAVDFYRTTGELQSALVILEKIRESDPQSQTVLLTLGNVYYEMENFAKAEEVLLRFHQIAAGDGSSHYLLGNVYLAREKSRLARKEFGKALRLLQQAPAAGVAQQLLETEVLWALGRRAKALDKMENLLADHSSEESVLAAGFYMYLDDLRLVRAREIYEKILALRPEETRDRNMEGALLLREGRFAEAEEIYARLLKKDPSVANRRTYADICFRQRRWEEAEERYSSLWKEAGRRSDLREFRRARSTGSPQADLSWTYFKRPQAERDYIVSSDMGAWLNPRWHFTAGTSAEKYTRKASSVAAEVNEFAMAGYLQAEHVLTDNSSFVAKLNVAQNNGKQYPGGTVSYSRETESLRSLVSVTGNHLSRDPIDAIAKEGTTQTALVNNRWQMNRRWAVGENFKTEWFFADQAANPFNDKESLGYKWTYDFFVEYALLLTRPQITLGYHYLRGHWQESFPEADQVIGYVPEEIQQFGTISGEGDLGVYGNYVFYVAPGYDFKRDLNFATFYLEPRIWLRQDAVQLRGSYEYDLGNSSATATGDSQIFKLFMTVYF